MPTHAISLPTQLERTPLSYPQEGMCLSEEIGAFDPRFIQASAFRVAGHLDVATLQAALDDLVVRHEILRTVVIKGDDRHQQIHPPCMVPLDVREVAVDPVRTRDEQAVDVRLQAQRVTMDVRELPLLRAELHRFDDRDAVLVLLTHHTTGDGWTCQLLMRDLAALYTARISGCPADLPAIRQYREFAAFQQERLESGSAAMTYWRDKMAGARVFALPTDRPDARVYDSDYAAHGFTLDADLGQALEALARSTRSSVFPVLVAVFNLLAHEIDGRTDIVINTMTAGRGERSFRDTAGLFVNFLALRTDIDGCASFTDVIARTRKTCFEAYHHEIPIQVVEGMHPDLMAPITEPMRSDFIVTYSRPVYGADGYHIAEGARPVPAPLDAGEQVPGSTIWGMALQPSGEIHGQVQYNPEIFDEDTIVGWIASYRRLLARAIENPAYSLQQNGDWRS